MKSRMVMAQMTRILLRNTRHESRFSMPERTFWELSCSRVLERIIDEHC